MNIFLKAIKFIQSRGVSDKNKHSQLTSLLNLICFLTSLGSLIIFIFTYLFTEDVIYMFVTLMVTSVYFFMILLHHFHQIKLAKLYFSTIIPLWYVITILLIGGHFSQSICAVSTIVIAFLMYKSQIKLRNGLIAYNIVAFILPTLYITFYPPIFGVRDMPFDEIVVFLLCLGWISIVFYIYEKEMLDFIQSLQIQNKDLEQKTLELERFNHIASHDLKSPLRNISSFLSLILRAIKKKDYESIEEYIGFVQSGTNQMNELIEGVLEISSVKKQSISEYSIIDLNEIVSKVKTNLRIDIQNKNAKIISGDLPSFHCYEPDLAILFQNFVQNGIKYNRSVQPKITITAERTEKNITIHFTDNGIGIPEEYQEQIFGFFKRLHTSQEFTGTGLGLGICKKIIDKYNGTVEVESEIDVFSTFSIHLPINKDFYTEKTLNQELVLN